MKESQITKNVRLIESYRKSCEIPLFHHLNVPPPGTVMLDHEARIKMPGRYVRMDDMVFNRVLIADAVECDLNLVPLREFLASSRTFIDNFEFSKWIVIAHRRSYGSRRWVYHSKFRGFVEAPDKYTPRMWTRTLLNNTFICFYWPSKQVYDEWRYEQLQVSQ